MNVKFRIRDTDLRRFLSGAQVLVCTEDAPFCVDLTMNVNKILFFTTKNSPVYVRLTTRKERRSFKFNKRRWLK